MMSDLTVSSTVKPVYTEPPWGQLLCSE